jgi:hypothetical protein
MEATASSKSLSWISVAVAMVYLSPGDDEVELSTGESLGRWNNGWL